LLNRKTVSFQGNLVGTYTLVLRGLPPAGRPWCVRRRGRPRSDRPSAAFARAL